MRRTRMLTTLIILVLVLAGFGVFVTKRADLREARTEARFPPEGRMVVVEGRSIHAITVGEGPDIVMIHGAGGNTRENRFALQDKLKGFRVTYFDRPGLGWSETAFDHAFSRAAESPQEQATILAAAAAELGIENPIVVGHSFGGAVAMAWALDHPAAAVVILSGATMPWDGDINVTYRILGTRFGGLFLAPLISAFVSEDYLQQTIDGVFSPQSAPEDYLRGAAVEMTVRTDSLRANNRQVNTLRPHIVEMSARYRSLEVPVEILHGEDDPVTPLHTHAIPLSETVSTSNLVILDGIGHMPHHVAKDAVLAAIERAARRAGLHRSD